ncbi:hypothetical protein Raf01_75790 [Rugosimonospora africana]|uniref:Uncharacterized protein n=1 Tax=Rugosimonospora africana TaxID=556532 RepID=A0A8J3VUD7_9ACTN|nr:hypothetical protein Raf01_75790 [Rugosimonospora africana]
MFTPVPQPATASRWNTATDIAATNRKPSSAGIRATTAVGEPEDFIDTRATVAAARAYE